MTREKGPATRRDKLNAQGKKEGRAICGGAGRISREPEKGGDNVDFKELLVKPELGMRKREKLLRKLDHRINSAY